MALYAFDGTGNEDKRDTEHDSNVLFFFNAYDDPLKTQETTKDGRSVYLKGIGARAKEIVGKSVAEAFGIGGHERIKEALTRLDKNVAAHDTDIDIVGFSRGAALAISFANTLAEKRPGLTIRFMGVFDIVGEFGLPGEHLNAGHNLSSPKNVKRCYHAMALDEHRAVFQLTRLAKSDAPPNDGMVEVWFRGVHSDVGGGNDNPHLNWVALNWMYRNALREGLRLVPNALEENLKRRRDPQKISDKFEIGPLRKIRDNDLLHASVQLDKGSFIHPHNNPKGPIARIDDDGNITPAA